MAGACQKWLTIQLKLSPSQGEKSQLDRVKSILRLLGSWLLGGGGPHELSTRRAGSFLTHAEPRGTEIQGLMYVLTPAESKPAQGGKLPWL